MKTAKLLGRGLLLSTTFISVFSGAAAWGLAQDGRISDSNNIDGASAQIDGESYNPSNPSCVVYSVIVASFDSSGLPKRQVETGLMRCNNATVDSGACTGGHAVAERYNGVGFVCVEGNTFNNGQFYTGTIQRDGTTTTQMNGSINGASISQGGFTTSDITKTRAWGETTDSCPTGAHLGNFYQWQRKISGSWSLVTNPNVEHNPALTCWTVGTYNNSTGGFDVH